MKKLQFFLFFLILSATISAKEYYVSKSGNDSNKGNINSPFLTIQAASDIALPGDIITVHEGIYRERINPPRGGMSDDNRIVYQAAKGEKVVIKGSEIIKGWVKIKKDIWKVTLPNSYFGAFNPYSDLIGGEWYNTPKDGYDRHTGSVYLNGKWLTEASNLDSVLTVTAEKLLWFGMVDDEETTITAQFIDVDPNEEMVEINVRQSIFYPDQPGRNYITVRGFTMCQAATPWSGAMSEQIGMIGTHWSKGWIIENNVISHSMNSGITLGRYDLKDVAMPPVTAPGYVESIELALENGWSKDKIGSHIVRNNHISFCEKNGIHGSLGGIFSTIEGNTICDIAMEGWISGPDVAGLKLLASIDVFIGNNHIYRCGGAGGVWLDWMAQGVQVSGNLLHDNSRDLFMEVNHGPFLIVNNIFLSEISIWDWSQGGAYLHNLIAGSVTGRKEKRETPYFSMNSVKDMKLSDIQHKDLRFYNNLFVNSGGLYELDEMAQNINAAGNVYVAGAKQGINEQDAWVVENFELFINLKEQHDGWWLEMNADPTWKSKQKRNIITTEMLGKAEIPCLPFIQRGGIPYKLDYDYFGEIRDAYNPFAGPFEYLKTGKNNLKVW